MSVINFKLTFQQSRRKIRSMQLNSEEKSFFNVTQGQYFSTFLINSSANRWMGTDPVVVSLIYLQTFITRTMFGKII